MNRNKIFALIILSFAAGFLFARFYFSEKNILLKNRELNNFISTVNIIQNNYKLDFDLFSFLNKALINEMYKIDPYFKVFSQNDFEKFENSIDHKNEGIGISLYNINDSTVIILDVLKNSPAFFAGLRPLDRIISINNKKIKFTDDVINLITNNKKIKIQIKRFKDNKIYSYNLQKSFYLTPLVKDTQISDSILYIDIISFGLESDKEFEEVINKNVTRKTKYLILDLRSNPGGYLSSALNIAYHFFNKGDTIIRIKPNKKENKYYICPKDGELKDIKLILLINHFSASASELLALTFQDNDRALIIGTQTFGKGVFQTDIEGESDVIHYTQGRYYGPSGRNIQIKNDSQHIFFTKHKRVVFGNNGIVPEIFCDALSYRYSAENQLFLYAISIFNYQDIFSKVKNIKDLNNKIDSLKDVDTTYLIKYFPSKIIYEKLIFPDSVNLKTLISKDSCINVALKIIKERKNIDSIILSIDTLKTGL